MRMEYDEMKDKEEGRKMNKENVNSKGEVCRATVLLPHPISPNINGSVIE